MSVESGSVTKFAPRVVAQSVAKSKITALTEAIDITDWLYNLDELEYNNCTPVSKSHISAGFTHTPDGKRMSINVEYVGGALLVEHYVEDVSEKLHCRVQSTSTIFINNVFTTAHVVWELRADPKEGNQHDFSNYVSIYTTEEFERLLAAQKIPYEEARKNFQAAVEAHNAEETPEIAASIERKALKRKR